MLKLLIGGLTTLASRRTKRYLMSLPLKSGSSCILRLRWRMLFPDNGKRLGEGKCGLVCPIGFALSSQHSSFTRNHSTSCSSPSSTFHEKSYRPWNKTLRMYQRSQTSYAKLSSGSTPFVGKTTLVDGSQQDMFYEAMSEGRGSWAVVAFGSNVGDRVQNIEDAIQAMRAAGISICSLSKLYETAPMYYADQNKFFNGAVLIRTEKDPLALLDTLQEIERNQGRTWDPQKPKGPRTLDLDIVYYQETRMQHERLTLPHPGVPERAFVLRPLLDVLPASIIHQSAEIEGIPSPIGLDAQLPEGMIEDMQYVVPLSHSTLLKTFLAQRQSKYRQETILMSILNITPDSFSDGGNLSDISTAEGLQRIVDAARSHIEAGATILDIGGQSTRPGAVLLTAAEELARVYPALCAIREIPEVATGQVSISLDTFHAGVVEVCAENNLIDVVNDVSAGLLDPEMLATVAKHRKTIVLMHMRGTPQTMHLPKHTNYGEAGVLKVVGEELGNRVKAAWKAGIPPWRIILDPGLGFAKTQDQNLDLLRAGGTIIGSEEPALRNTPWLVGPSRKGFIGRITGIKDASKRDWGTSAAVVAAVAGGAAIVRVHAPREMKAVVKMADAIWRQAEERVQKPAEERQAE